MRIFNELFARSGISKIFLVLVFSILFVAVSVSATYVNEWAEFGDDIQNRQWVADDSGIWTNISLVSSSIDGNSQQSLIADLDNDSIKEIIVQDGYYLQIYHFDETDGLIMVNDYNCGGYIDGMLTVTTLDRSGRKFIVGSWNDHLITFGFNDSQLILHNEITTYTAGNIKTGTRCINWSGVTACLFGRYNGSKSQVLYYTPNINASQSGAGVTEVGSANGCDIFEISSETAHERRNVPVIWDIDKDTNLDALFMIDYDCDGKQSFMLWDIESDSMTCEAGDFDSYTPKAVQLQSFNVNANNNQFADCIEDCSDRYTEIYLCSLNPFCFLDDIGATISDLFYYQNVCGLTCSQDLWQSKFGGGSSEIGLSWYREGAVTNAYDGFTTFFDSNCVEGDSIKTADANGLSNVGYTSNVLFQNFMGDDDWEYCAVGVVDNTLTTIGETQIRCFDTDYNLIYDYRTGLIVGGDDYLVISSRPVIVSANMDEDVYQEIVVDGGIILDLVSNTSINTLPFKNNNISPAISKFNSLADVDNNQNIDVVSTGLNSVDVITSTYINEPPSLVRVRADGVSPICVDSVVTISVDENLGDYINDGEEDEERIRVVMPNGTVVYSEFSLSNPYVTFSTATPGVYEFDIYLQDEFNQDYMLSSVKNFVLRFSDNAQICNEPGVPGEYTTSDQDEADSDEAITQGIIDEFISGFGIEPTATFKMVMWLILMIIASIAVITGMYSFSNGSHISGEVMTITLGSVNLILYILGVKFGALPIWTLVVGIMGIISFAIIIFFKRGG